MDRDIAIIGMAGRFPEAPDLDAFYRNLEQGRDSVRLLSLRRKVNTGVPQHKDFQVLGFMEDIDLFDHDFFGMSAGEARYLDPHQRLLLETVYHAIENAGYAPRTLSGSRTAVFIGDTNQQYAHLSRTEDPMLEIGSLNATLAGRIARFFNLQGSALMIDTACSSSLVALHMAINELLLRDADQALVCGVSISLFQGEEGEDENGVMSQSGKCRTFSAKADGIGVGEATGCVLLKPLARAEADGDHIWAIIKGSAVNQDAGRSSSLSAPSWEAQSQVMQEAWRKAGIDPQQIGFIEAHGTGTKLGDPIEIQAITDAFLRHTSRRQFCAISSAKANIGHADTAAGITGLFRAVLALRYKTLFPAVHFDEPNPFIDFASSPLYVNSESTAWESDNKRVAGVSSFGVSGTNCHVVLEEAGVSVSKETSGRYPFILSAKTEDGLTKTARKLQHYLEQDPDTNLADLSHTLCTGRDAHRHRAIVSASSVEELLGKLEHIKAGEARAPDNVWMVCSPDFQVTDETFRELTGSSLAMEEIWDAYQKHSTTPESNRWRSVLYAVALYRILEESGLASRNLMGLAEGKLAVSIIKGEKTYDEAFVALAGMSDDDTPEQELKKKLTGFTAQKLNGHSLVVELGPEGVLSRLLKELKEESKASYEVLETGTSLETIRLMVAEAWQAGLHSDWKPLFADKTYRKLPLPGYTFAPVRCWLDDSAQVFYEPPSRWAYERVPEEKPLEDAAADSPLKGRRYLFVSNDGSEKLVEELALSCASYVHVQWGEGFKRLSGRQFVLGQTNESDFVKLADALINEDEAIQGIIFLQGEVAGSEDALQLVFAQSLLIKEFVDYLRQPDFHVASVRTGSEQSPGFNTLTHSAQALSRSLLSDFIGLNVHDITCSKTDDQIQLADLLQKEFASTETVRFVTLREGKRYVEKLQKAPAGCTEDAIWEPTKGNRYLVAGGARGAAFEVMKEIAARTPSHFIILGRSAIDETDKGNDRATNLRLLEEYGATVDYYQVNIADELAMKRIGEELQEKYDHADYVINAAGTSPRTSWDELNMEMLRDHTEAKVEGTRLLHALAGKLKARRYVLFSSLNTLFPDRHSFTYSLACAWQDGYAAEPQNQIITSINWGIWAATNEGLTDDDHESPILPFATHIAKKGVELALTEDIRHFVFADLALGRMAVNPFYSIEDERSHPAAQHEKTDQNAEDLSSGEEKLLAIWKDVLRNSSLKADDNFFQVGGHSLIAIRIINLIRKAFGVTIEFRHMLEYPTVRKLTIFIQGLADTSRSSGYTGIMPAPAAADYPLSHAQKRLWILDQMENMGHAYVVPRAYTFRGGVDAGALQKAFAAMVERHESFRTTFKLRDGEPRQVVHPDAGPFIDFQVTDLKKTSRAEEKAREMATEEAAEIFDLENGPLLRGRLLLVEDGTSVFIYTMHHIISDEWSLNVFRTELIALYQGYAGGQAGKLADLQVQYKDFAVWQNNVLADTAGTHKQYWLQQFSGSLPVLQLPTDYARPARLTFSGDALAVAPDRELLDLLSSYGQKHGLSLFMILMSAIKVLFYRYTGQQDLILGTPVAGRDHDELEEQIGYYVNTLAIRSQLDPEATFEETTRTVKENILQAFEHQVYPFDKIVEDLQPATPAGHRPLFDTMVLLQNAEVEEQEEAKLYGGIEVENFSYGKDVSKFDVTFEFTEHPNGLSLYIEYNSDLFRKKRIEHIAVHLWQLLNEVATGSEKALKEINILSEGEKNRLLTSNPDVEAAYPGSETIVSLFERQAAARPGNTALLFANERLSYIELNEQANRLANFLLENYDIKPDARVGVMMPRGLEMIISIMGILKAGAAYLPIDPGYPAERRQFIVEDAAPVVVLTGDEEATFSEVDIPLVDIRCEAISHASPTSPVLAVDPAHLAYIIYTSGSTGRPKGVMIGHRQVVRLLFSERFPFHFSEQDTWITLHSVSFDFSVWEIFGPLLTGGKLVVASHEDMRSPADVLALLQDHHVTVLNQTPTVFSHLTNEVLGRTEKPDLALRYVVFGGEALNPATLGDFHLAYPETQLVNMYGITETTVHVTYKEIGNEEIAKGSSNIGRPLPTLDVLILDEHGQLVPEGVTGEIAVVGSGLARGYLNKEALTAERFAPHPYKEGERIYLSGDLGMRGFDGDLYYFGRKDKQVKIRGYRIELGEIEHSLLQHAAVGQALVTVLDDDEGRKQLVAYCKSDKTLTYAGLKSHLRSILPDYMVPAYFVQVEEIHVNANGKADIGRLPDPLTAGLQNDEYVAPQNQTESQLLKIFAEALQQENLGTHHNFFAAGGDSIKAIRLAGRIDKVMERSVAVKDIYLYPNVTSLAAFLDNKPDTILSHSTTGYDEVEKIKNSILANPKQAAKLPEGWQDLYPMSAVEKGMLFYNKLYEGQHVFHDQFFYPFSLQGFNAGRFGQAFSLLVDRHEILRTSFHTSGFSLPIQVVHSSVDLRSMIPLEYVDEEDETALKTFFDRVLEEDREQPFDPEEAGLWRMRLFALPGERFVLLWVFHHAIMDGWSNASLMTELLETYDKLDQSPAFIPEPLAVTYKDYVAGELQSLTSADTRQFWQKKLREAEKSALPFDRIADAQAMQEGLRHYRFALANDTGKALSKIAARHKTGVKDVLIGAFLYFLRFTTTGRDLVIGLIGNGRPEREDGDKVMGCFLNSLPLRVDISNILTGTQLIQKVTGEMVAMKPHEKFPLLEMGTLTGATAGQGGNAFFDIVFNYVDFHVYDQASAHLEESGLELENHEMADTPFDLTIRREGDTFHCQFAYPQALYTSDDIERLSRYFTRIAENIAYDPKKELSVQDLLDSDELTELSALNDT
ncbi:MAG: amino acid adenylation domain-containing protein, partial [Cyclobacteriaceae bacterium]